MRKFWSCRAYTWAELTGETHGHWSREGGWGEHTVWQEELELRALDGVSVYRYDHDPLEVRRRLRSAHEPQDVVPAGYEDGPESAGP
ncbi:hypothetical protein [Streptomyces sp. NPDC001450]